MPIAIRNLVERDAKSVKEVATAFWNFTYSGIYSDN
jgi:hypothetical protein